MTLGRNLTKQVHVGSVDAQVDVAVPTNGAVYRTTREGSYFHNCGSVGSFGL